MSVDFINRCEDKSKLEVTRFLDNLVLRNTGPRDIEEVEGSNNLTFIRTLDFMHIIFLKTFTLKCFIKQLKY